MVDRLRRLAREKLAAIENPLRLAMLTRLAMGPASVGELAESADASIERVRYHVNRMREVGLVESAGRTRRRGVAEELLSVDPAKFVLSAEEMSHLSSDRWERAHLGLLRVLFREANAAMRAVAPGFDEENVTVRFALPLDAQAWQEALRLHDETMLEVLEIRKRSLARLDASGEAGVEGTVALLFFEAALGA